MLSLRPIARRAASLGGPVARATPRTFAPRVLQRTTRRGYSSHGDEKSGSDVPWMIGAVAVMIPGVWWGLQPSKSAGHGDDHGHGEDHGHGDHAAEEKHEEKPAEGEESNASAETAAQGDEKSDEQPEEKEGNTEGEGESPKEDSQSK